MIKPDQVPDEVADAIRHCFHTRGAAKVEIAAALNAWPWKFTADSIKMEHIVLPLPEAPEGRIAERMEASDE